MQQNWSGKIAVVTGASAGIGACITVALANAGMIVIGLSRRTQLIEKLNDGISNGSNGKIISRFCDLTDEASIVETFHWIHESYGSVHVFINNAGIIKANFLTESTHKEIKDLFDLNVLATTICLREVIKNMRDNKTKGHIFVINSILGHRIPEVPMPLFSVYPATKHAITALCQTARQEIHFFKMNVKLTSINPGMVDTDFLKVYSNSVDGLPKLKPSDVADAVVYALETPCNVQVEDITLQAMRRYENNDTNNQ